MRPLTFMALGLALIVAGFSLPFLMALRFLEPGFALSFSAHLLSSMGLLVALYGVFRQIGSKPEGGHLPH
jgi:hypothetical protein